MRVFGTRFRNPWIVGAAGTAVGVLLRSLFLTVRMEIHHGSVQPYKWHRTDHFLFSVWHDTALMASFGGRNKRRVALTSKHRDGEFGAKALRVAGVKCVRGSSGKSGARGALALVRAAKTNDIVVTPDGPRGPRRQLSPGIVYLASKTGNPIVPTGALTARA